MDKSILKAGDFNILFSIMDRTSRQSSKEVEI